MGTRDNDRSSSLTNLLRPDETCRPIGIKLFGLCYQFRTTQNKRTYYKGLVIFLTFLAYATFHMGRRPLSIVKNVLNKDAANPNKTNLNHLDTTLVSDLKNESDTNNSGSWAPFDDDSTANQLLGWLDTAFLLSYAVCMFFSGIIAERMNLRYLVSIGTILSGLGLIAFGLAYSFEIHSFSYFIIVQLVSGAVQSSGWPVVVTCIGNWFEPSRRGLIYGIWNSHTNLGNILGATIAGVFVEYNWGLSFIVPGLIMILVGLILFLFLTPNPRDVGLSAKCDENESNPIQASVSSLSVSKDTLERSCSDINRATNTAMRQSDEAVSFLTALRIPGVVEYSFCLFFSKLVSYTFLYWLPRYIKASTNSDSEDSAYLSTPFDIGGIVGAILAGYLSDKLSMSGLICNVMLILAIPAMFFYESFGSLSNLNNIMLQLVAGALVNGPYCLITTAVSADLSERVTDGRAMATVSAIIDGMGSIGAVIGPLFAGYISKSGDWKPVFIMLMLADVFASLCLVRVTVYEIRGKLFKRRNDEHQPID